MPEQLCYLEEVCLAATGLVQGARINANLLCNKVYLVIRTCYGGDNEQFKLTPRVSAQPK